MRFAMSDGAQRAQRFGWRRVASAGAIQWRRVRSGAGRGRRPATASAYIRNRGSGTAYGARMGAAMYATRHHFQVKRDGTVVERGQVRGRVEKLGDGWQAIDRTSVCDDVRYYTRRTAAMSL